MQLFYLLLLPALAAAKRHGHPKWLDYSGQCDNPKDTTGCTVHIVAERLRSQCQAMGGQLFPTSSEQTPEEFSANKFLFGCQCVHGDTESFTYADGTFTATATVGGDCNN